MMARIHRGLLVPIGIVLCLSLWAANSSHARVVETRFEISYPGSLDSGPITGRVFVMISRSNRVEPRLQAGSYR